MPSCRRVLTSSRALTLALAALVGTACHPPADADERAFYDLMASAADGDCDKVLKLRDEGFVVDTIERADAANTIIGVCQYRSGDFATAAATLDDAGHRTPPFAGTPRAAYFLARSLHRADAWREAEDAYLQIESRFSASRYHDDGLYHRGRLYLKLDEHEAARQSFETLGRLANLSELGQARAVYGRARAQQLRGELNLVETDLEGAAALYQRTRELFPESSLADNALYREAKLRRRQARCAEAIELFEELPDAYPDSSWVPASRYQRARCLREIGQLDAALDAFQAFPQEHPDSRYVDNALYYEGRTQYSLGLAATGAAADEAFAAARDRLDALRAAHPASFYAKGAAYYGGRAAYRLGEWVGARERFNAALALGPSLYDDNATYYRAMCNYHVASLPDAYLDVAAELDAVEPAFPDSPYLDNAAYFAARSVHRAGQLEDAARRYLSMAARFPLSSYRDNALYQRVVVLLALDDCPAAEATLDELTFEQPDSDLLPAATAAMQVACP